MIYLYNNKIIVMIHLSSILHNDTFIIIYYIWWVWYVQYGGSRMFVWSV